MSSPLMRPRDAKDIERAPGFPRNSHRQANGAIGRSFLVELDASGLTRLRQDIETGSIDSGPNDPEHDRAALPSPPA
jgi:hypothetical protein